MRKITIFGIGSQRRSACELGDFFSMLRQSGINVCVTREFAVTLRADGIDVTGFEEVDSVAFDSDLVVSIGGDGTFLRAASAVGASGIPVMGINTGHLGYLAPSSLPLSESAVRAIHGVFEVSERMTLQVLSDMLPESFSPVALNEIAISKGDTTSMVSIQAYVNGHYLAEYQADGLIVSTPTGSTAYSLSCGGPILEPTLEGIVLSPIAPHSLTVRPLVVAASSELRLEVSSRGEKCHVGVDGRTFTIPAEGSVVRICRGEYNVKVAQPRGIDFSEVLREKLHWGSSPRH